MMPINKSWFGICRNIRTSATWDATACEAKNFSRRWGFRYTIHKTRSMIITGKSVGSRRPLFADWSIPIPPSTDDGDGGLTLRELIERIVREQVALFRKRQHDRQFIRALSADEISLGAERGKVDMGGSEIDLQEVDEEHAVHNALQAFEDGIYLVVIDEQQQTDLDQQVFLNDDSQITFIRLAMLSGG